MSDQINKEFLHEWRYEFESWRRTIGFDPIQLVFQKIGEEDYTTERGHVFKMRSGNFASVYESGCSCYDPSEASIDFFETEVEAIEYVDKNIK